MDFFFKKQATHKIFKIHYLAERAKRIWTNIRKKNHTCSRRAQMAFRLLTYIKKKVNNETTRRVQELDGVYLQSLSRIRRLSFVWQGVTISYLSTLLLFVFKTFFWYKRVHRNRIVELTIKQSKSIFMGNRVKGNEILPTNVNKTLPLDKISLLFQLLGQTEKHKRRKFIHVHALEVKSLVDI